MGLVEIILSARDTHACPIKVRNGYTPGLRAPLGQSTEPDAERDRILDEFVRAHPQAIDLRPLDGEARAAREQACVESMVGGADIILGATLPTDHAGHRQGSADILVRGRPSPAGLPGYRPIHIHRRRVLEQRPRGEVLASTFARPRLNHGRMTPNMVVRASRVGDRLELAHAWHLLSAAQHASLGMRFGGLIGPDTDHMIAWAPLDEPCMPRSAWATGPHEADLLSTMDRYDQEYAVRIQAARRALAGSPRQLSPIRTYECGSCPWWEVCEPLFDPEDISLQISKLPLDAHEISALRALGVWTITDLTRCDIDALLPAYEDLVSHRPEIPARLRAAARRARMMRSGAELERTTSGPILLPHADLEIDLDIEASADNRVYLWGFLVHDVASDAEPYYRAFAEFGELSDETEAELAHQAMVWLHDLVDGVTARVFHYSDYELVRLAHIASLSDDLAWAPDFAEQRFVDLFAVMREHFFAVHGLGLKNVATQGAGFAWRDAEPGGLNSQGWFDDAVHGPLASRRAARQRVLTYNEDDVWATWHLRRWLRTQS